MSEQWFGGPYVQVAAICTTPLVEQGGQLSVIRIQDRIQVAGVADQMLPQSLNNLCLLVVLKSGEMRGKYNVRITPITPSGKELPHIEQSALFEGEERGWASAFPLAVTAEEEGLYWFNVTLEGSMLARIPLRVMYQKLQSFPGMQFPQSKTD